MQEKKKEIIKEDPDDALFYGFLNGVVDDA